MDPNLMEVINELIENPDDVDHSETELRKVSAQQMIDALQELVKAGIKAEFTGTISIDHRASL